MRSTQEIIMPAKKRPGRWDWLNKPITSRKEAFPSVQSQLYSLRQAETHGFIQPQALTAFREKTGLFDFTWRVTYHQRPTGKVKKITDLVAGARGYVIFMHGWTGSHAIWEDLPAQVCQENPHLVCFALDVNGFAGSPFIQAADPPLTQCGPQAEMLAIELWLEMLKIQRPGPQKQVFTFVGHSMSGAALFHKTSKGWEKTRYNLIALAPSLLHKDTIKQSFYRTMGFSIGAGLQYDFLSRFKNRLAGPVMEMLAASASQAVKREHARMFQRVEKGTIAKTFFALGQVEETPAQRDWSNVFVMLGHNDRLVAVAPTLDLLADMGLNSWNVQVVLGDHYFFSISYQSRRLHAFNRAEVLRHILRLHEQQRKGG